MVYIRSWTYKNNAMIIANPLYDVVFKYLLEDLQIARELLSAILEEEVYDLRVKPQEAAVETYTGINIVRFDFTAILKMADGQERKVLIELQKAKQTLDVRRFRRYLGEHYRKDDEVQDGAGPYKSRPLPIVSIYILGFTLENVPVGIIKVNREYRDVITREVLQIKDPFVELLTHDSYVIQVSRLPRQARTKLERVLQVFSPVYEIKRDRHQLDFQGDLEDPLVKKMVTRLSRAIADEEMRVKMDIEDELDFILDREIGGLATLIAEKESVIAEKENVIAEKENVIAEKENVIAEKESVIAEKENVIAEKENVIAEKESVIAEKENVIAERDQLLQKERERLKEEAQKNTELQRELQALKKRLSS